MYHKKQNFTLVPSEEVNKNTSTMAENKSNATLTLPLRPPCFDLLKAEINKQSKKRSSLEFMLSELEKSSDFDTADLSAVKRELLSVVQEEKRLCSLLSKSEEIYSTELKGLQEQLRRRHETLRQINDGSDVFSHFEGLGNHFAKREAELSLKIETVVEGLEKSWQNVMQKSQ
jgi:hypothetical protein